MVKLTTFIMIIGALVIVYFLWSFGIIDKVLLTFGPPPTGVYAQRNPEIQQQMTYLLQRAGQNFGVVFESQNLLDFRKNTYYDDTVTTGVGLATVVFACENNNLCYGGDKALINSDFLAPIKACCSASRACKIGIGNINISCS